MNKEELVEAYFYGTEYRYVHHGSRGGIYVYTYPKFNKIYIIPKMREKIVKISIDKVAPWSFFDPNIHNMKEMKLLKEKNIKLEEKKEEKIIIKTSETKIPSETKILKENISKEDIAKETSKEIQKFKITSYRSEVYHIDKGCRFSQREGLLDIDQEELSNYRKCKLCFKN